MPTQTPEAPASAGEPQAEPCPRCHGRGWVVVEDGGAGAARPCECSDEERGPRLLAQAGIPERYRRCRLDNFRTEHPEKRVRDLLVQARKLCGRYVEEFFDVREGRFRESGLLFLGPPGVGKTHLAVAVLGELVLRYRVRGRFVDFTALLREIQATFDGDATDSQNRILKRVTEAEVLVLDELGARRPTDWVMDTLYHVINTRYTRRLPTIFTTNYRLEEPGGGRPAGRGGSDDLVSDRAVSRSPRGAAAGGPTPFRPELLTHRIPPQLVSRLWEMAQPVRLELGDFDHRRDIKMHGRRSRI